MRPVLYGDHQSGNCYKNELLFSLLNKEYEFRPIDILKGETQTAEFKSLNPKGGIPVVDIGDGRTLSESNAILNYFSTGTQLQPQDPFKFAQMLSWQFFEQYKHEPNVAVARFIQHYLGLPDDRLDEYKAKQEGGYKALQSMEDCLADQAFLVGEELTIADISLYAYTHVAHEGGFVLARFPAINRWIERIKQTTGYKPMASAN